MNLKINNKKVVGQLGQTILELAKENGIKIPSLCHHPDLSVKANCRVCVVEIKGYCRLMTACSTKIKEGMEIYTNSSRVKKSRNLNLELLFAEHAEKCGDCSLRYNCTLLDLAKKYKVKINRFQDRKGKRKTYTFANAIEIDGSQCIDCQNCVEACHDMQGISCLKIEGEGINQEVKPAENKETACIYCGQCTLHCPVAAAQEQSEWQAIEKVLKDKTKVVVAQFAPSIRITIGEEFGLPLGTDCTGKTVTALKKLGFNQVFDVNFGADITTMVEAEELIERLNNKKAVFPMMTSCCPAWVAYVEFYHPELIPNLTTSRSPHIHSAGAIKTYWAKKKRIDPKKIIVVSVMPCTAKKYEAKRAELKVKGLSPVDYVITTREFSYLLKKNDINLKKLAPGKVAKLFNDGSGAAAIYGSSGGVMESALRTANALVCQENKDPICSSRLEFQEVRGLADLKEATVNLNGKKLKVAVVNGLGNIKKIIKKLNKYHYVEVMSCPGGCIGGGGQPLHTNSEVRKKRVAGLYKIDQGKKIRKAHENKEASTIINWLKKNKLGHKALHTKYSRTKKAKLKNNFFFDTAKKK